MGCVGPVVGQQLYAFSRTNVDLDQLMKNPQLFLEESFTVDARYMSALMLAGWVTSKIDKKNAAKEIPKAMPLLDTMTQRSREFVLLICTSMSKQRLVKFIKALIAHDPKYKDMLSDIALNIKQAISI